MFDTHTHLNDDKLFPDREQHITDFINQWWQWLVNIAVNAEYAMRAIHIAKTWLSLFPDTFIGATVGIHPSEACFHEITKENLQENIQNLKKIYYQHTDVLCAIGECGIDLHYPGSPDSIELQQELLALQCQMAQETWLPLVIHSREGFQETIDVLKNFSGLRLVFHCFGYWPKEAEYILSHFPNTLLGFDCNITYPKAEALREACKLTPLDRILTETDAPYLAPQWLRWTLNTPSNVKVVYESIAQLKNIAYEECKKQLDTNAANFYDIEKR